MRQLPKIIRKNMKLLFRTRTSIFTILFGPLLLILLVGLAFNNAGMYKIKIGFHTDEFTNMTLDILESLEHNDYQVTAYQANTSCVESVRLGESNICLLFASMQIAEGMDNRIDLFVDYSEFNLAYMVIGVVNSQVRETSANVTSGLTATLIDKMGETVDEIKVDQQYLDSVSSSLKREMSDRVDSVDRNIGSQELAFDKERFTADDVQDISDEMQSKVDSLVDYVESRMLLVKADLQGMNESLVDSEAPLEIVEQVIANIDTRRTQFEGTESEIQSELGRMEDYIAEIDSNLKAAAQKNDLSDRDLQELRQMIAKNREELDKIRSSFEDIKADLSTLQVSDARSIANPIKTSVRPLTGERTHLSYMFPSLIVLFLMFVGIILSSSLVIREKNSNAFLRNYITPTKGYVFVLASYVTSILLILAQLFIILVVAFLFLELPLPDNMIVPLLLVLMAASLFVLIGMAIGYLFRSEEFVTLVSILGSSLMILLSGIILPLESMHEALLRFASLNPFVLASNLLKKSLLYDVQFTGLMEGFFVMLAYVVVAFLLVMYLQGFIKRKYLPSLHITDRTRKI